MDNQRITQLETEIHRLKSAVAELTVLNDLAIAASTTMEVEQMLDTIVQKSIKAIKAEQGSILLVTEHEDSPLKTLIRQVDGSRLQKGYHVGTHITGWVLKNRQALIVEDLAKDNRFHTTEQETKEIRSVLCVPIWFKAKILGVLMLINKKTAEPFNSDDLRLISIIAAQSGQLITNSQLQKEALEMKRLEQELELARRIQMSLLPKAEPKAPGIEISSYFNPAEAVGGDYYDYFMLSDHRIGIVVADVSGHGPSAAMLMTMVKGVLHTIAIGFRSADQALCDINAILAGIIPKGIFITMIFLVFDLKEKTLQYSNAGHNPFVFYSGKTGKSQLTTVHGPALNITAHSKYQLKEMPIEPNDLFLIYTDGITEAFNGQVEMFGEERLVSSVEESASNHSWDVIVHIRQRLHQFINTAPQSDDVAMIAVKIT
jgi:sigma-B regulation protein RsbU (phosphoserine phosphatase)